MPATGIRRYLLVCTAMVLKTNGFATEQRSRACRAPGDLKNSRCTSHVPTTRPGLRMPPSKAPWARRGKRCISEKVHPTSPWFLPGLLCKRRRVRSRFLRVCTPAKGLCHPPRPFMHGAGGRELEQALIPSSPRLSGPLALLPSLSAR